MRWLIRARRESAHVDAGGLVGILGQYAEATFARQAEVLAKQAPPETLDKENIAYFNLDPDSLTDQVVHAIRIGGHRPAQTVEKGDLNPS